MFKEKKPSDWFDEIERGLEFRKQYGLEGSWSNIEAMFYNLQGSQLGPNLIASTGDSLLSTLSVLKPQISLKADRREEIANAMILEAIDNKLISQLKLEEFMEMSILHAFLWGRGILKVGYDSEWGYRKSLDLGTEESPIGATLTQFDKKGRRIEFKEGQPGMPWVLPVLPHDIVVPWGTIRLEWAPWVAHRVIRHIDEIKADPKYKVPRDLRPSMSMDDFVKSYVNTKNLHRIGESWPRGASSEDSELCELWEIHDRATRKIQVISASCPDKYLRNEVDELQLGGLPFVEVGLVPSARCFWTTSDAFYLMRPQKELDEISSTANKIRKVLALLVISSQGAISPENADKFLTDELGFFLELNEGRDLSDIEIRQHFPQLGLYDDADHVRRDAREAVGFSRNQHGEYEQRGRRTATEARIVDLYSSYRMDRKEIRIGRSYVEAVKRINEIIFSFWDIPRVVDYIGEDGERHWVEIVGSELRGHYSYDIQFTPGQRQTYEDRAKRALELYSIMSQDPMVNQQELRNLVSRAFNDPGLKGLFSGVNPNADLPMGVQGMQGNNGGVPSSG